MKPETNYPKVLIFSTLADIDNETPTIRTFEFLSAAQLYADMLSSYPFPLIRVINFDGSIYCEHEN